jgi:hypothetical protein
MIPLKRQQLDEAPRPTQERMVVKIGIEVLRMEISYSCILLATLSA